jgi:hypothetical protein
MELFFFTTHGITPGIYHNRDQAEFLGGINNFLSFAVEL